MILIILPIRNEQQTIKDTFIKLLLWCENNLKDFRIIFVDDGSADDSYSIISSLKKSPRLKVLKNRFDRGKGSALKTGFILSSSEYKMKADDLIIFMDGDGQIEPSEVQTFMNVMRHNNADVVIGNKRHIYSVNSFNFMRKIVSKCYNIVIRILFDLGYDDTQCGLKIFKKSALERVIDKITIKKFAFDLELIVALREMRMKIADSPVMLREQVNMGSVSLSSIIITFIDTLKVWFRMKKGFYKA